MNFFRSFFSTSVRNPENLAMASAKAQKLIDENAVVVFSKSWCPYCQAAKQTLDKLGAQYTAFELDKLNDGSDWQDALEQISGQRSVPNIFFSKKHIGGNSDLQKLFKDNKLEGLLKEVGALAA